MSAFSELGKLTIIENEELKKEIAQLKEQLKREMDCVDFYANTDFYGKSGLSTKEVSVFTHMTEGDLEWFPEDSSQRCGKLARLTQQNRSE